MEMSVFRWKTFFHVEKPLFSVGIRQNVLQGDRGVNFHILQYYMFIAATVVIIAAMEMPVFWWKTFYHVENSLFSGDIGRNVLQHYSIQTWFGCPCQLLGIKVCIIDADKM